MIRVAAEQAEAAAKGVRVALEGLGQAATVSQAQIATHERATNSLSDALSNQVRHVAGLVAAYFSLEIAVRAAVNIFRSGLEEIDKFNKSAIGMAALITSLATSRGPETFGQALAYSRAEAEKLEQASLRTGVSLEAIRRMALIFGEAGIFPRTDKDIAAMAQITQAVELLNVRGYGESRILAMQINELLAGHITNFSTIGRIIAANLPDLKQWVEQHKQTGDLLTAISGKLAGFQQGSNELNKTLGTQVEQLKVALSIVERQAFGGMYESIVSSVAKIKNLLVDQNGQLTETGTKLMEIAKMFGDTIGTAIRTSTDLLVAFLGKLAAMKEWLEKFRLEYGTEAGYHGLFAGARGFEMTPEERERRAAAAAGYRVTEPTKPPTYIPPTGAETGVKAMDEYIRKQELFITTAKSLNELSYADEIAHRTRMIAALQKYGSDADQAIREQRAKIMAAEKLEREERIAGLQAELKTRMDLGQAGLSDLIALNARILATEKLTWQERVRLTQENAQLNYKLQSQAIEDFMRDQSRKTAEAGLAVQPFGMDPRQFQLAVISAKRAIEEQTLAFLQAQEPMARNSEAWRQWNKTIEDVQLRIKQFGAEENKVMLEIQQAAGDSTKRIGESFQTLFFDRFKTMFADLPPFIKIVMDQIGTIIAKWAADATVQALGVRQVLDSITAWINPGAMATPTPAPKTGQYGLTAWTPTLALIGEHGPETVTPWGGGSPPLAGMGGTVNIFAWDTSTGMNKLFELRDYIADMMAHQGSSYNAPLGRMMGDR